MNDIFLKCIDGVEGLSLLPDKSIKLLYGSPPYPNAVKSYGVWEEENYIEKITPFLDVAKRKLTDNGFIVINIKANRKPGNNYACSERSLVVEKLAIAMRERWELHCVDIEIWVKTNSVPTGLRVACQDVYEQMLWFSIAPKWKLNIDDIRTPYKSRTLERYSKSMYKPCKNGNTYFRKEKRIRPNPLGALPKNVIEGGVSALSTKHQAVQPIYLSEKYIKACTNKGDLVVDPWLGTGTTGVSALKLQRKFAGFDLENSYIEIAQERISVYGKI